VLLHLVENSHQGNIGLTSTSRGTNQ
jgi:hypothetical protein